VKFDLREAVELDDVREGESNLLWTWRLFRTAALCLAGAAVGAVVDLLRRPNLEE
jgi:hypothetical protein